MIIHEFKNGSHFYILRLLDKYRTIACVEYNLDDLLKNLKYYREYFTDDQYADLFIQANNLRTCGQLKLF